MEVQKTMQPALSTAEASKAVRETMPWYRRKWFNALVILAVTLLTAGIFTKSGNPKMILALMGNLNPLYIGLALLSMLIYLLLEAVMMHLLIVMEKKRASIKIALKSTIIGQYYSMITPFATGGQPMQLIAMVDDGLEASHATAILVNKFLYFQVGVSVYAGLLSLLYLPFLWQFFTHSYGLLGVGVLVNFVALSGLVLTVIRPKWLKLALWKITGIFEWLRGKRSRGAMEQRSWFRKIDDTAHSTRRLLVNKPLMLRMMVLTAIQLTAYFGITYFIYRAFGLEGQSFLKIVSLQAVLYLSVSLLPMPGSAGVAEGSFHWIFGTVFTSGSLMGAMLVWRGISYYLNLLISGALTLYFNVASMRKHHKALRG